MNILTLEYDESTGEPLQTDIDVFVETWLFTEEDAESTRIYRLQLDIPLSQESVSWLKSGFNGVPK